MDATEVLKELKVISNRYHHLITAEITERKEFSGKGIRIIRLDVSVDIDDKPAICDEYESYDELFRELTDKVRQMPIGVFDKRMYRRAAAHFIDWEDTPRGDIFECTENGLNILVEKDDTDGYDSFVTNADFIEVNTDFDSDMMIEALEDERTRRETADEASANTYTILERQF